MWKFLLDLFKKALVLVVGYVLLLVIGVALMIYSLRSLEQEPRPIETGSVLVIDLAMDIPDTPAMARLGDKLINALDGGGASSVHLLELIDAIDAATADERVAGIFLHGNFLPAGYGTGFAALGEFRAALERFRQSGKPVYAYLRSPGLREIYLTSVADEIALHPYSEIDLSGLAITTPFFADALERAGIGIQTLRAGRYKSALEPFTETELSPESREQIEALAGGLWAHILDTLATARGIDASAITQGGLGGSGIYEPEGALEAGLVDAIRHFDEVLDALVASGAHIQQTSNSEGDFEKRFLQVGLPRYLRAVEREGLGRRSNTEAGWESVIAVVYAEGDIVDGAGTIGNIGGDRLAARLRELRRRDEVKAVVLRINTPGGSAQASEVIHREMRLLAANKPLVVSFGTIAASGGYWIAAPAERILLDPMTITGSIGVFGLTFHIDEAAAKLGVNFETVKTGRFANISGITRPRTEAEMAVLQHFVDRIYADFLIRVADGRSLTMEEVEAVAEGRVFTGAAALELGLADRFGGILIAIDEAADLSGLQPDQYRIEEIPGKEDPMVSLLATLFAGEDDGELATVKAELQLFRDPWLLSMRQFLESVRSGQQIQTRLPVDLHF